MYRPRCFDPDANRFLQTPVKRFGFFALVSQSPFDKQFACGIFSHGNLLIARVEITTYNQHCSAPFLRASVVSATKFTRS